MRRTSSKRESAMRATQVTHSDQASRMALWVFNLGVTRPCLLAPCVTRPVYKNTVFQALQQPLRSRSARLFGAGEGLLEAVVAAVYNYYLPDSSLYERTVSATRSRLGDAGFEEAQAEGRAITFEQAVAYALEDHDAPPN